MDRKRADYTSPAVMALIAITEQMLCLSNDPETANLGGLRIEVDTENGLDDDDWD